MASPSKEGAAAAPTDHVGVTERMQPSATAALEILSCDHAKAPIETTAQSVGVDDDDAAVRPDPAAAARSNPAEEGSTETDESPTSVELADPGIDFMKLHLGWKRINNSQLMTTAGIPKFV
jgi:hypothetical protein